MMRRLLAMLAAVGLICVTPIITPDAIRSAVGIEAPTADAYGLANCTSWALHPNGGAAWCTAVNNTTNNRRVRVLLTCRYYSGGGYLNDYRYGPWQYGAWLQSSTYCPGGWTRTSVNFQVTT